jgi:hypothetical protein
MKRLLQEFLIEYTNKGHYCRINSKLSLRFDSNSCRITGARCVKYGMEVLSINIPVHGKESSVTLGLVVL